MKNLIKIAALAALLGAPAFGEETASIEVAIPTSLENTAALEEARMAILDAATELCEAVDYSGVSAFYKPTLDRRCIADAYANALAQEPTGRLIAYVEDRADPYLLLAQK